MYKGSSVKCITKRLFKSCHVTIKKSFLGNPILFKKAKQEMDVK